MEADKHVSTLETTFAILETLQDRETAGVSELATALDMSKANVHKHLTTLRDHGFMARDGQEYRLGLRFYELGVTVRDQRPLYQETAPKVVELAEITNQTATMLIPSRETGIYMSSIDPGSRSRSSDLEGERRPLHETASGRAVLSQYSESRRLELVPEAKVTDALSDHLDHIDEQGVVVARGPGSDDRQEIAAPVTTGSGAPVGAVALIIEQGLDKSEQVEQNYKQLIKKTGATLSKRMRLRHEDQ